MLEDFYLMRFRQSREPRADEILERKGYTDHCCNLKSREPILKRLLERNGLLEYFDSDLYYR